MSHRSDYRGRTTSRCCYYYYYFTVLIKYVMLSDGRHFSISQSDWLLRAWDCVLEMFVRWWWLWWWWFVACFQRRITSVGLAQHLVLLVFIVSLILLTPLLLAARRAYTIGNWCLCCLSVCVCHQTFLRSLLFLQFFSDSYESWHAWSTCQYAKELEQIFEILIFWNFWQMLYLRCWLAASGAYSVSVWSLDVQLLMCC